MDWWWITAIKKPLLRLLKAEGIICGTTSGLEIPRGTSLMECHHTPALYRALPSAPTNGCNIYWKRRIAIQKTDVRHNRELL